MWTLTITSWDIEFLWDLDSELLAVFSFEHSRSLKLRKHIGSLVEGPEFLLMDHLQNSTRWLWVRRPRPHRPGASESSRRNFPQQLPWTRDVDQWVFGFWASFTMSRLSNCSQWTNQTSSIRNLENCQVFRSLLALLVASWPCFCCFQFLAFQCRIRWRCPMLWRSNASVPEGAALICIIWNPRSCARSVAIRDLLLPFKIPVGKKHQWFGFRIEKPTTFWW